MVFHIRIIHYFTILPISVQSSAFLYSYELVEALYGNTKISCRNKILTSGLVIPNQQFILNSFVRRILWPMECVKHALF